MQLGDLQLAAVAGNPHRMLRLIALSGLVVAADNIAVSIDANGQKVLR